MIPTYAASRLKLPQSAFTIALVNGTATAAIAGNYNVYISAENRAGLNQLSDSQSINIGAGDGLAITINSDAIASGEDPFWIVISIEKTGNAGDVVRVASWKVKNDDQVTRRALPVTIALTTDEHFNLTRTVANFAALPNSGLLDGAIALTADDGAYWRYDSEAIANGNNYSSYGTIVSGADNWIRYFGTNNTYIADSRTFITVPGSDRPLSSIQYALTIPPKIGDGDSTSILYWLNNGYENDGQSPIVNGCYTFEVRIGGIDYSGAYSGSIKYTLKGYVSRDTGVLDTTIDTAGDLKVWTPTDPIKLPVDLPRNYAALYSVFLSYAIADIANKLPTATPAIELNIVSVGSVSGNLSAIANSLGNTVQADRGKLLINSSGIRQSGIATIKMANTQGFLVDTNNEQPLQALLAADTDNQVAAIAGSLNGLITIRQENEVLDYSERVRAIIGTATGISNLNVISPTVAIAATGIKITVTHPVNSSGLGIVRADYLDRFLAGNQEGAFTPTEGGIILKIDGVIWQETNNHAVNGTATQPTQEFLISDLSNYTQIGALPTQDADFSLFEPVAIALEGDGTGTISGNVTAYYYYSYNSPNNKPTRIRHDTPEVEMATLTVDLGEAFEQIEEAVEHKDDLNNPHQVDYEQTGAKPLVDANTSGITTLTQNLATTNNNVATNVSAIALNTTARQNLGSSANLNVGTSTGDIVQLENVSGSPGLPAIDGSQLTGVGGQLQVEFVSGTFNAVISATSPINYLIDTSTAVSTATLPASPPDKGVVAFSDRNKTFGTNNATITPGAGHTINGNSTFLLDFDNEAISLIFDAANNNYVVLDGIQNTSTGSGDMVKSVYDQNDNGIVDEAEAIAGTPGNLKFYGTDNAGTKGFFDYLVGSAVKTALESLVDADKLLGSAIANARNITATPVDDYCLTYDLASNSLIYKPRVAIPGAGAILLPLSQSLFETTDGALSAYVADVGTATFSDCKILTTAAAADNQIVNQELVINTTNTGAVVDLGVSDTVLSLDWEFNTGDNLAIICRYSVDGSMVIIDLSETAIATKTVVSDVVTTIDTTAFTFVDSTTYSIEVQVIGVQYKISIDGTVAIAESLINDFITATSFGIGRLN